MTNKDVSTKQNNKIKFDNLTFLFEQYCVLSDRHISHNQILWTVPSIFFAAQTLLLALAIGFNDVPLWAQMASSALLVLFSILSMQIFERNRLMTVADAMQLEYIEKYISNHGYMVVKVHQVLKKRTFLNGKKLIEKLDKKNKLNFLNTKNSYILWRVGLLITTIGSFALLIYKISCLFHFLGMQY